MRDFRSDCYNSNRPRRDFAWQSGLIFPQVVYTMFWEPMHQVLEKIKNEPYFKWPNKISRDPLRHNQSLHCQYHQERGYATEDCRTLWNHLKQLVRVGRLQQYLYQPNRQGNQSRSRVQGNASSRPPLGTINFIFTAPDIIGSHPSKVKSIAWPQAEDSSSKPKRAKVEI